MENTQLLKNIAELEARCLHLEWYVQQLGVMNFNKLELPLKDSIQEDLEKRKENAKEKYGVK